MSEPQKGKGVRTSGGKMVPRMFRVRHPEVFYDHLVSFFHTREKTVIFRLPANATELELVEVYDRPVGTYDLANQVALHKIQEMGPTCKRVNHSLMLKTMLRRSGWSID